MTAPIALIIGGGFYGCALAIHLKQQGTFKTVRLAERNGSLMQRASLVNQARVHQGYHYPRDFVTAWRSRISFPRFIERYGSCVVDDFTKLYAISRQGSKVSARQFESMMKDIGAPVSPAGRRHAALFSEQMVEAVYEVKEFAFDSAVLARQMQDELAESRVELRLGHEVVSVTQAPVGWSVTFRAGGEMWSERVDTIFNCTYGQLFQVPGLPRPRGKLKYEICELALIEPPPSLRKLGITLMDGAFFSSMPFPSRGLHSLTHVRWTPHLSWTSEEASELAPYAVLERHPRESRAELMKADAARFMPIMKEALVRDSLYEVKTVLQSNEANDGRPILLEGSPLPGGMMNILGGKLDNIFDAFEEIDNRLAAGESTCV